MTVLSVEERSEFLSLVASLKFLLQERDIDFLFTPFKGSW